MARPGLFGGGISRASRGERRRAGAGSAPREGEKKRKAPPFKVVLRDAAELLRAHRGRLVFGFALLAVNRLCGLVLPARRSSSWTRGSGRESASSLVSLCWRPEARPRSRPGP